LQKQIEEGAPADVFISAGKKQVDTLSEKKLVDGSSRFDLLTNKLVLIVAKEYKDKIKTAADIANLNVKISIGTVETVPAGQYAKETLTNLKLWDKIEDKIVYAKDVKQVVTYVESGNAAAGIVYNSDAAGIKTSSIAEIFDEKLHKAIVYPAVIVSASKEKESAQALLDYLKSDKAQEIFKKHGFNSEAK
jgi:molybdate transport system substrate-binding protein